MKKKVIKPFDMEAAKAGAEVETRAGRKVRILCYDVKCEFPIVAIMMMPSGAEVVYSYRITGKWCVNPAIKHENDLVLVEYINEPCSFKPFDKVLVRDYEGDLWKPALFSHYKEDNEYPFVTMFRCFKQCIPYGGNEDVCLTTKNPE